VVDSALNRRKESVRQGIAAYGHEQAVLLRLLRMKGSITERDFDRIFSGRRVRKLRFMGFTEDTFILGLGANGFNEWARWLDLMQHMIFLELIDATTENGLVVYRPLVADSKRNTL
jgi:hypothetical protein